jgi:hypothetical protein
LKHEVRNVRSLYLDKPERPLRHDRILEALGISVAFKTDCGLQLIYDRRPMPCHPLQSVPVLICSGTAIEGALLEKNLTGRRGPLYKLFKRGMNAR